MDEIWKLDFYSPEIIDDLFETVEIKSNVIVNIEARDFSERFFEILNAISRISPSVFAAGVEGVDFCVRSSIRNMDLKIPRDGKHGRLVCFRIDARDDNGISEIFPRIVFSREAEKKNVYPSVRIGAQSFPARRRNILETVKKRFRRPVFDHLFAGGIEFVGKSHGTQKRQPQNN